MTFELRNESILGCLLFVPSITRIILVLIGDELSSQVLSAMIYSVLFILAIPINMKVQSLKVAKILSMILFSDICLWIYTFVVNVETNMNIDIPILMFAQHVLMVMPAFLIASNVKSIDACDTIVKKMARTISAIMILLYFFKGTVTHMHTYDMALGYSLVFVGVILLTSFFKDKKMVDLFLSLITLAIALKFGSRGIILVYIAGFIINLFYSPTKIKIYSMLALSMGIVSVYIGYIYGWFEESRTINFLFNNKLLYLSGRDRIFEQLEPYFFNAPLLGNGLGFDRMITNNYGLYAHNLFLEGLVNNGLLLTTVFGSLLLLLFIKNFEKLKKIYSVTIVSIIAMQILLLISSSYVTEIYFWLFIGLSLCFLNTTLEKDS